MPNEGLHQGQNVPRRGDGRLHPHIGGIVNIDTILQQLSDLVTAHWQYCFIIGLVMGFGRLVYTATKFGMARRHNRF